MPSDSYRYIPPAPEGADPMTHGHNPVLASMTARRSYWATHKLNGNRADADRAADLAYNAAVLDGPRRGRLRIRCGSWKRRRHHEPAERTPPPEPALRSVAERTPAVAAAAQKGSRLLSRDLRRLVVPAEIFPLRSHRNRCRSCVTTPLAPSFHAQSARFRPVWPHQWPQEPRENGAVWP